MAKPIAWPIIVASLMPVSKTLCSPNFNCKPSSPWFTPPIFPESSPNIKTSGYFVSIWEKLSLKTSRPSQCFISCSYETGTADIFFVALAVSEYKCEA